MSSILFRVLNISFHDIVWCFARQNRNIGSFEFLLSVLNISSRGAVWRFAEKHHTAEFRHYYLLQNAAAFIILQNYPANVSTIIKTKAIIVSGAEKKINDFLHTP